MILSYCVPCCNRSNELKIVLPFVIAAANYSPPVEIVVLDYNSSDDIDEVMEEMFKHKLHKDNKFKYIKYQKGKYYHMAHARNVAALSASGEYIIESGSDVYPSEVFFSRIREKINQESLKIVRLKSLTKIGIIAIDKKEFIKAGGYDEAFEFYGSEDRDLNSRLERRGLEYSIIPHWCAHVIGNATTDKAKNYNSDKSKNRMMRESGLIWQENNKNNVLVANEGKEWGKI